jgi:DNA-3-methyladenine glycosylase II
VKETATSVNIEARLSRADPALGRVIRAVIPKLGKLRPVPSDLPPFEALARAIIYQRMAYRAAETIYNRTRLTVKQKLTPRAILALPDRILRAVGLSDAKAKSIQNLANWFIANPKLAKSLDALSNEDLIESLTGIPGIGVWTVNVFLIFHLQRIDVVPAADLGIRRGVQLAYGLSSIASPDLVEKKALRWRPYRSIASMYIWQSVKLNLKRADLK